VLCNGQTLKQEQLCVKPNGGARCGQAVAGKKKRYDEISCGAAGGLIIKNVIFMFAYSWRKILILQTTPLPKQLSYLK